MKAQNLTDLTDEQLLKKIKSIRNNQLLDAVLVGFTLGIVIYSAVKNGFGFFTFFPLLLTYAVVRNAKNNAILENELQNEINSRNLK